MEVRLYLDKMTMSKFERIVMILGTVGAIGAASIHEKDAKILDNPVEMVGLGAWLSSVLTLAGYYKGRREENPSYNPFMFTPTLPLGKQKRGKSGYSYDGGAQ